MAAFYTLASALFIVVSMYFYLWAYPRPYPGIPHNKSSAKRLWGDLPEILAVASKTQDPAKYVFAECRKLNSPVIQLFLRPFHPPIIFVDDVREVKDILGMRTKEFDRAPSTQAVFAPFLAHSSITKRTTIEWRAQRRLWEGVMGKDFLRRVAAPRMYTCASELVELLKVKATVADGRPFSCFEDFDLAAFDVIWTVIFGEELQAVDGERRGVIECAGDIAQPKSKNELAILPVLHKPEIYEAVSFFVKSVEKTLKSFNQALHHWALRKMPAFRRYWSLKQNLVTGLIKDTRAQLAALPEDQLDEFEDKCAMGLALRRERLAYNGKFEACPPTTQEIHDELFMFLVAGHETKAVTLSWTVKFLTTNPSKQAKLREILISALPNGSQSSVEDILNTPIHYLEATMEEAVRLGNIHPRLVRIATVDTSILGYPIPKGAQVVSSSYVGEKPLAIPEEQRSKRSQQSKVNFRKYYEDGMDNFVPERWLDEKGEFDSHQYPTLAFSAGPRVCYGRALARQELRITLTLLILNFEFEALPEKFNSMEAHQRILRVPQQCFVRLKPFQSTHV
ncbi:hypothetical protein Daus18300_007229 [Diaporthe australafricana]|uniref:Cytochrome P450 n=1 Tax=Diaporthe australafricana TaxID=127596 RepID=A0ABR3WP89_9PEZI